MSFYLGISDGYMGLLTETGNEKRRLGFKLELINWICYLIYSDLGEESKAFYGEWWY